MSSWTADKRTRPILSGSNSGHRAGTGSFPLRRVVVGTVIGHLGAIDAFGNKIVHGKPGFPFLHAIEPRADFRILGLEQGAAIREGPDADGLGSDSPRNGDDLLLTHADQGPQHG